MKPAPRIFISEGRVYYLVCQMRRHQLTGIDADRYKALCAEWNTFMCNPNQSLCFSMPAAMLADLRRLEMLLHKDPADPAPARMAIAEIPEAAPADTRRAQRSASGARRPHGYWSARLDEIEKKYSAGAKAEALAKEYDCEPHQIFTLIYRARKMKKAA